MSLERPARRRAWPGWDGAILIVVTAAAPMVWLIRGQLGGGGRLLLLAGLVGAWLLVTGLTRRFGRVRLPPRPPGAPDFSPVVVIPSKDNESTIAGVASACRAHEVPVLVVDDGCVDGTAAAARAVAGVEVLVHPKNMGKGAALNTAFHHAWRQGHTHAICLDADGQHDPADVPGFIETCRADPWAIHAGVRDMSTAPGRSQFGMNFSNWWTWVETGHRLGDTQCGFRAYPLEPVLSLGLGDGRYEWEVEVLVRSIWRGVAVRDRACGVFYPPEEERVSSFRPFWDNLRISLLNTRLVLLRILWPPTWSNRVPPPGGEWRGRHLGTLWGWRFFIGMIRLLGRGPTHGAMVVMSAFYLLFAKPHREGVLAYLRRAQAAGLPVRAGWPDAWRIFHAFACSIVDRFVLLVRGPQAFTIVHEQTAQAKRTLESQGAIFLTAHLGNPDLGATALQTVEYQRPVNVLQYTAGDDPYMRLLREYLPEGQAPRVISLNAGEDLASLEVIRALRRGEIVAIKGDRVVDERTVEVELLGAPVRLPTGPFLLAALSKAPLFVLGCFHEGGGRYRVIAGEPWELRFTSREGRQADLARWTQRFASQLEDWARRYPHQWYNFHDPWA
jgi:predicted LPLAT superfamily acyltransferase